MGMGVIYPIDFVVDYIINTGGRYFISWLEFITLVCHLALVSSLICQRHKLFQVPKPNC